MDIYNAMKWLSPEHIPHTRELFWAEVEESVLEMGLEKNRPNFTVTFDNELTAQIEHATLPTSFWGCGVMDPTPDVDSTARMW
jgi:hypothetical protein